ncbi:MAG: hypothetical protein PHY46_04320, partial [Candidatus Omnitrophica bacterium]|nr:hypothetical protein [Candidatus Omnitrophota bacterium]
MKETDIRPKKLYGKFIDLLNKEVSDKFKQARFKKINCPACESEYYTPIFRKFGFSYCECRKCSTIFVNPMPEDRHIKDYYKNSKAIKFLAEKIYQGTAQARKIKIFRPRAKIIKNLIREYRLSNYVVLDIGGGSGLLANELKRLNIKCQLIEPSECLARMCSAKHIKTHNVFLE